MYLTAITSENETSYNSVPRVHDTNYTSCAIHMHVFVVSFGMIQTTRPKVVSECTLINLPFVPQES
jgi:hypothetical protein